MDEDAGGGPVRVAYTLSRFPKITETFILGEMNAMERHGIDVMLCPLRRERTTMAQPTAAQWLERASFWPLLSWHVLLANAMTLGRLPVRYVRVLAEVVWGNRRSLRLLAGALSTWPRAVAMAAHLQAAGVRHLHCHFATHPALAGYVVHRLVGISYSFTGHGSDLHRSQEMLREKVAAAEFVIAISEDNRRVILDNSDPVDHSKVHVIHCGVDLAAVAKMPSRGGAPRSIRVACVGTLHEVKGQRYLLEALAILLERGVDAHVTLVGDGPDRHELQELARMLSVEDAVQFAGRRSQPEVFDILRSVDVLVAPSVRATDGRREGIPVALMEGMASGLPVVASRLSGIPELVDDGRSGMLVPPRDVAALATALEKLADDVELREHLGSAGRATIEAEFDLDANARRLADLFVAVLRG